MIASGSWRCGMPFGSEGIDDTLTGLAMSGGGFRATLFHLGTLWRLNELAHLPKVDRISSVSGGSITAGVLAVVAPPAMEPRPRDELPGRDRDAGAGVLRP